MAVKRPWIPRLSGRRKVRHVFEDKLLDHFKVTIDEHWVVLQWAKHAEGPLRVAVLRSESAFAEFPAEVFEDHPTQMLVYEGDGERAQDQDVTPSVKYHYTCFARLEDGQWEKQHTDHARIPKPVLWKQTNPLMNEDPGALDRLRISLVLGGGFSPGRPF